MRENLAKLHSFMLLIFVDYYLLLNKSIRLGNFELFKYVVYKIAPLFFALNQPNYSRHLTLYHNNLENVDKTHPGLLESHLEKGSFSARRSDYPFCREPIDKILEETVNRHAGGPGGVTFIKNSPGAITRFCLINGVKSSVVTHLYDYVGKTNKQEISSELKPHRIKHNTANYNKLLERFEEAINPFSEQLEPDSLYNIYTGKSASENTCKFLTSIEDIGTKKRVEFLDECSQDAKRFSKAIKRSKVSTFRSDVPKRKMKILGKHHNVLNQRNLFGTLLGISLKIKIDMKRVATYPMVESLPTFTTPDGKIYSTDKSKLISAIEEKVKLTSVNYNFNVEIIDGSQVLRQLKNVPVRIGDISDLVLKTVTRQPNVSEIHVIFDRYPTPPTLKDYQHTLRNNTYERYTIRDGTQVRSRAFSVELNNPNFKEALSNFFVEDWKNPTYLKYFIGRAKDGSEIRKTIFVNHQK